MFCSHLIPATITRGWRVVTQRGHWRQWWLPSTSGQRKIRKQWSETFTSLHCSIRVPSLGINFWLLILLPPPTPKKTHTQTRKISPPSPRSFTDVVPPAWFQTPQIDVSGALALTRSFQSAQFHRLQWTHRPQQISRQGPLAVPICWAPAALLEQLRVGGPTIWVHRPQVLRDLRGAMGSQQSRWNYCWRKPWETMRSLRRTAIHRYNLYPSLCKLKFM